MYQALPYTLITCIVQEEVVNEASVGWAAATLLSRAFSLDLAEEEPLEGDMSYFGSWWV